MLSDELGGCHPRRRSSDDAAMAQALGARASTVGRPGNPLDRGTRA